MIQVPIPFSSLIFGSKKYIGSGVLSVMGTSFTFLPVFELAIGQMKADGISGEEAYGKMLGTSMVCCLLELIFSFGPRCNLTAPLTLRDSILIKAVAHLHVCVVMDWLRLV